MLEITSKDSDFSLCPDQHGDASSLLLSKGYWRALSLGIKGRSVELEIRLHVVPMLVASGCSG
jgi:hypothetical protein